VTAGSAAYDDAIAIVNALRDDDYGAVATVVAHASDPGAIATILLGASTAPLQHRG
jgi:hypothetical protein